MRSFRHITPRYVADRLVQIRHEHNHPEQPWLTPAMVDILETWLKPDDRGLEWGAGRSTAWFAARMGHLTSIEDNAEWMTKVQDMLRKRGLSQKVTLHAAPIPPGERGAQARYVRLAETIAPESLDFCLVDGDLRDHCALAGLGLLKPGGLIVVDNVERHLPRDPKSRAPCARGPEQGCETREWEVFRDAVAGWRCVWLTSGTTDTAFWQKPFPGAAG